MRTPIAAALVLFAAACKTPGECLERVKNIEAGGEQARAHAAQLVEQLQGAHAAELGWHDATRAALTLELSMMQAKWVESWRDPDNHTDIGLDCRDHVRVRADAALRTSDGRLQEQFASVAFDELAPGLLSARLGRKQGALQGAYVRQGSGGKLSAVNFEIELGADLFRGSVYEESRSGDAVSESPAIGRWETGTNTTSSQ